MAKRYNPAGILSNVTATCRDRGRAHRGALLQWPPMSRPWRAVLDKVAPYDAGKPIETLAKELGLDEIVRLSANRFNVSDILEQPRTPGLVDVTIDRLRVDDGTVVLEDRTLRPVRTWTAERITIDAHDLSTVRGGGRGEGSTVVAGAPVHVTVDDVRLAPVHLRAHVSVGNVDLTLLRLYLPGDAVLLPVRGVLAAGVTIEHDTREGTRISAGARIRELALESRRRSGPVATSPEALVTLNDLRLKNRGAALARAEIEGDLAITESIVSPSATHAFTDTRLIVGDLTWPADQPGRVSVTARLPGGGTLDARGTLAAEPMRADARVRIAGADLALVNRYAGMVGIVSGTADVDAEAGKIPPENPTKPAPSSTWEKRLPCCAHATCRGRCSTQCPISWARVNRARPWSASRRRSPDSRILRKRAPSTKPL